MLADDTLEANATFELRFEQAVAKEAEVGRSVAISPLIIQPALEGQFIWLSQRSGVFVPSEQAKLGTEYRLSLRSGMSDAQGGKMSAGLFRKVHTPDFGVLSHAPMNFSPARIPADPTLLVQFNARLDPKVAATFFSYANSNGVSMRALVAEVLTDVEESDGLNANNPAGLKTWEEQFRAPRANRQDAPTRLRKVSEHSGPNAGNTNGTPFPGRFIVRPEKPLPVGNGWKLVVDAGLPSSDGSHLRLKTPYNISIGDIKPFSVVEVEPMNALNAGKRVRIQFSKPLAPNLGSSNLLEWFQITPPLEDLKAILSENSVLLKGSFDLNKTYRLRIKAGLPSEEESFTLAEAFEKEVSFNPIPARLYFPSFSAEQWSGGIRQMELLSVNVSEVRIRAKLLDQNQLIHALRGYKGYFKDRPWEEDVYEPYQELDFNLMAGKTVYSMNLTVESKRDEAAKSVLAWDKILGGRPHGAVFLMAELISGTDAREERDTGGRAKSPLGTQTLIQLTDLGLYWKPTSSRLWTTVFSYATGKPVPGASVRLLDNDGETLIEGATDTSGLIVFEHAPKASWLLAKNGDDVRAVSLDSSGESRLPVDYTIPRHWNEDAQEPGKLMVFSDRSVYRPGETLHLKAILREFRNDTLEIPQTATGKLVCIDAKQRKFLETNLTFSALGSADVSVLLPSGNRGSYRADLTVSTNLAQYYSFEVQDYQPNAFEIHIDMPESLAATTPISIPVQAKYLHGRPVAKAKLNWSIEARDHGFAPGGWEGFAFCSQANVQPGKGDSSMALNGETNLTSADGVVLRPTLSFNPAAPQPRTVDVLVEMTDATQQTLSHRVRFTRHSSDFYIGIKSMSPVVSTNEQQSIYLVAARADGKPEPSSVKTKLRLLKVDWRSVRVQGAGNTIRYENEPDFQLVTEQEAMTCSVIRDGEGWTIASNTVPSAVLAPLSAGLYLVEMTATDGAGNSVYTTLNFNVTGAGQLGWNYRNEAQIDLVPDRKSYSPGQTATILVKTPISGVAMVSMERDGVMRSYVTNLDGNAPAIQIPILPSDTPNVVVTLFLMRGSVDSTHQIKEPEYRVGYCNLTVENPATELKVEVGLDKTDYQPGQAVVLSGVVRDDQGHPAAGAEVICYAVDEGILALDGYQTPNPGAFFWEQRPLSVFSYSSLPMLLPEDPAVWHFQNKGYSVGGGGEAAGNVLRKNFLACAYWNPSLMTDANGQFSARFDAPDSLTRYRVIAVAHRGGGQFGHVENSFRINKPLMLEPSLPSFAHVGDRLLARVVAHNLTTNTLETEINLNFDHKVKGTEFTGSNAMKKVTIAAMNQAVVEFPVEFTGIGRSHWEWQAKLADASSYRDRVESQISVEHATPQLHEVYLTRGVTAATNLLAGANPQIFESQGTLTVTVANSRMAMLGEAVSGLLHYPYGCVEQTSSSLMPWIVWGDFSPFFPDSPSPVEVKKAVQKGIERLFSMQTESGGLAYWPGGTKPMLWASAYGGMALALAKNNHHPVAEEPFKSLLDYLSQSLRQSADLRLNEELSDRCLALYTLALAQRAEPSYQEQLYEKRELLSGESRAVLAIAILESGGQRDMAQELLSSKVNPPGQGEVWFGCPEREMAVQLLARVRENPEDARVETLAEELFHSQKQGRWATTQGNAWGLMALADYVRRIELAHQETSGSVNWGGEKREFKLPAQPQVFETLFSYAPTSRAAELTLDNPQRQPLFARVAVDFRPKTNRLPRADRGFALRREYSLIDDDGKVREFKNARVGDLVLITLRLESQQTAHYVAIDDVIPSILEPVNPKFDSRETRAGSDLTQSWESNFHEFRQDHALFFSDYLAAGQYTLKYLARVRAAGTALAPNAKIEEMYHPERFGLTEADELQSIPLE